MTKIAGFASMFGLLKLYSKQSLLRFLWKKVNRLEKSTPTPLVALQTNMSYVFTCIAYSLACYLVSVEPMLKIVKEKLQNTS